MDGKDIRTISQHDLRDELGYVPQKGVLSQEQSSQYSVWQSGWIRSRDEGSRRNPHRQPEFIEENIKIRKSDRTGRFQRIRRSEQRLSIACDCKETKSLYF